jgi:hypothetical protein
MKTLFSCIEAGSQPLARKMNLAGGRALIPKNASGWPTLAGLFLAKCALSFVPFLISIF